jgi:putative ATPase
VDSQSLESSPLLDDEFFQYLASFADGDSRIALNVVEIAADLSRRPNMTKEKLKQSLTKSLIYDRSVEIDVTFLAGFKNPLETATGGFSS